MPAIDFIANENPSVVHGAINWTDRARLQASLRD